MRLCGILAALAVSISGAASSVLPSAGNALGIEAFLADFADPPTAARPRFRYWIPNGAADPAIVANDIKEMAEKGFGGAQIIDFQAYGLADTQTNSSATGWASESWYNVAKAALEAGVKYGMALDWCPAPAVGASSPLANPNVPGTSNEIVLGAVLVPRGTTFNSPVPRPLAAKAPLVDVESLVAVVTVRVNAVSDPRALAVILAGKGPILAPGIFAGALLGGSVEPTATAATAQPVIIDETTLLLHPSASENSTFVWKAPLDAEYLILSFWSRPTGQVNIPAGPDGSNPAEPVTHALYTVDHYSAAGANLIIETNNDLFFGQPGKLASLLRETGKYMWEDSVESITRGAWWTPGFEQLFRNGRGYDLRQYLPVVFMSSSNLADYGYRLNGIPLFQLSGPDGPDRAHQIRNDYFEQLTTAYTTYVTTLKTWAHDLGLEYSFQPAYNNPVDDAWFYLFAEMHGPRQPSWEYLPTLSASLGRMQTVLATGEPSIDVVLWKQDFFLAQDNSPSTFPDITSLFASGYSFDFASPSLFDLPTSVVVNKRLSPVGGPGYRALILNNYANATAAGLRHLIDFASAGLPIVIVGDLPVRSAYFGESDIQVRQLASILISTPNVLRCATEDDLPQSLASMGVFPSAQNLKPTVQIVTFQRYDPSTDTSFFFLTNRDTVTTSTIVSFSNPTLQPPYSLNPWTGVVSPIAKFQNSANGTDFVFADELLSARIYSSGNFPLVLSNGSTVTVGATVPNVISFSSWDLVAETWVPVDNNGPVTGYTTKAVNVSLSTLQSWLKIPELTSSSGTGVYTSTFEFGVGHGAKLDLGTCFHTCNASINGRPAPTFDLFSPVVDISHLLRPGTNTVTIEVSTPLNNFVGNLRDTGYSPVLLGVGNVNPASLPFAGTPQDGYGLTSPIVVRPFLDVPIH
ncbi:hypothetical protein RQP46_011168 [Phenoliferia psychrophenolica]